MTTLKRWLCVQCLNWCPLTISHSVHMIFQMETIPHFSHLIILASSVHYGWENQVIVHLGHLRSLNQTSTSTSVCLLLQRRLICCHVKHLALNVESRWLLRHFSALQIRTLVTSVENYKSSLSQLPWTVNNVPSTVYPLAMKATNHQSNSDKPSESDMRQNIT